MSHALTTPTVRVPDIELSDKLLAKLSGTHSKNWVSRADLLATSGENEAEFAAVFEQMLAARVINTCNIIRAGVAIEAVWLTGYVDKAARVGFTIKPNKLPPSGSTQPDKPAKDEIMEENTPKKSIPQQVLDIIICEPGITPDALRARFQVGDKNAVANALFNLRKAGRIERSSDSGVERLHPTAKAADQRTIERKAPASKSLLTESAIGVTAPLLEAKTTSAQEGSPPLEIHFRDDEVLYLVRGGAKIALSYDESARVRRFIDRVMPEAA